jgi:hypothetical protein
MKILYLEGFSPGPGLPYPLLQQRVGEEYLGDLNEVIYPHMPYYWKDLILNPYVLLCCGISVFLFSSTLPQVLNFPYQSIKSTTYSFCLLLCLIYLIYFLKGWGVRWTVNTCVSSIENEIRIHQPDVLIGYSWGGGIASFLIDRKIWLGHTILIAPATNVLAEHTRLPLPSLRHFSRQQSKYLFIIQGSNDGVTSYSDNWKLYQDAIRDEKVLPVNHRSHHLTNEATPESFVQFYHAQGHDHALIGYVTRDFLRNLLKKIHHADEKDPGRLGGT